MFNTALVITALNKLIGWRNHYDLTEVPALAASLNTSETGEFFQDYHPVCDLKVVNAIKPDNQDLDLYLQQKTDSAILQMVNEIILRKRDGRITKSIIQDTELIDSNAWTGDTIASSDRFVGLAIKTLNQIGLQAAIKRFSGHFTDNQTITFYLFHSSQKSHIKTYELVIDSAPDIKWFDTEEIILSARTKNISGGVYYFGYYEEDITGFALNVNNHNWTTCGTCNGHSMRKRNMDVINNSVEVVPFYVDNFTKLELPSPENIEIDFDYTWGINFSMNVGCEYTQFILDNKISMKNIIGKSVVYAILKDCQYSQNLNFIEESVRHMIVRDLEGAKDSNYVNIADQLEREMKAVKFDQSKLSTSCLAADTYKTPNYGMA